MRRLKSYLNGIFIGLLIILPLACGLLNPCDGSLEATWNVSPDFYSEEEWCKGLCKFEDKTFDKVERHKGILGSVDLKCYCCK